MTQGRASAGRPFATRRHARRCPTLRRTFCSSDVLIGSAAFDILEPLDLPGCDARRDARNRPSRQLRAAADRGFGTTQACGGSRDLYQFDHRRRRVDDGVTAYAVRMKERCSPRCVGSNARSGDARSRRPSHPPAFVCRGVVRAHRAPGVQISGVIWGWPSICRP